MKRSNGPKQSCTRV